MHERWKVLVRGGGPITDDRQQSRNAGKWQKKEEKLKMLLW